jgi:CDP-glucose 4,6-dehydratase
MKRTRLPSPAFWNGRKVFLTGHTGFKGAWLALMLHRMGAIVAGSSLPPKTVPNLFEAANIAELCESRFCDLRNSVDVGQAVTEVEPEIVLHLAAQALVLESYNDPVGTFASNVLGTANLLNAARRVPRLKAIVVVTSDKVYRNLERMTPYAEDDKLGGHDPYSASKAACELIVESMRKSFFDNGARVATARAGNVIGGGDWSAGRLIPDAVRAWSVGQVLDVRNPSAVRPWQHVLEPLSAYLVLAEALVEGCNLSNAYNIGPATDEALPVRSIVELARQSFGKGEVKYAREACGPHEAGLLTLDSTRAANELDIHPRWSVEGAVDRTMKWYAGFGAGQVPRDLCLADIIAFQGNG